MEYAGPLLVNTVLNGLDAIAYGPLLTGHLHGISLYLLSTTVAQAVLPIITSFPFGATACTMVEAIPFLDSLRRKSDGNMTVMLSGFAMLTVFTGVGFAVLRFLELERAIRQFPRVVLLGMMAGVGLFLIGSAKKLTGINSMVFNYGVAFAVLIILVERRFRIPYILPFSCLFLVAIFYIVAALYEVDEDKLRRHRWLPRKTSIDPFYYHKHLSLSQFDIIKLAEMVPIALAGSLFNLLHVPINVPSLSRFSGLPFNMDRELLAHAVINCVSAIFAFTPTYMAYTNSIIFLKSGCKTWWTSLLLSATTAGLMVAFEWVIGWVPTVVAVFLISNLGIDLVTESALVPLKFARRREVIAIWIIMLFSSQFGFITGLCVGVTLSLLILYLDTHKEIPSRRPVPEMIIMGVISDRVSERFAAKFIHTTTLDSHLTFIKSLVILDSLQCVPPDSLFHIIDFTKVASCDLNVMEGLHCILNGPSSGREYVFVNCELKGVLGTTRNFPSHRHALKYCEMRMLQRLNDSDKTTLESEVQAAMQAEQHLLFTSQSIQLTKQVGEALTVEEPYLLHITTGHARILIDEDRVVFLETGSWVLPPHQVTFTSPTTATLVEPSHSHLADLIYSLYYNNHAL